MAAGMDMDGEHSEYMFGDPMEASDASRVIEITANDDFTFSLQVQLSQRVRRLRSA
jgi:hypothetical protein